MIEIPDFAALFERLEQAPATRSAFNFLQLATIGLDGAPQVRTIVMRGCSRAAGTVSFVTDIRSPKIVEIGRDPRVSLIGYDMAAMVQMRMTGRAEIVADEGERRRMWTALKGRTLLLFDAPLSPGTPVDAAGNPLQPVEDAHAPAEPFERFALVTVSLSSLEWLDLSAEPHRRILYRRGGQGWTGSLISP